MLTKKESHQRLLDEALKQMRRQQCQSRTNDGMCLYRDGTGNMCAFGPAIESYATGLEDTTAAGLLESHKDRLFEWAHSANYRFADELQECHDHFGTSIGVGQRQMVYREFLPYFESQCQRLATKWGLEYTPA